MPKLVEDAGGELSAGLTFKAFRLIGDTHGCELLAGRKAAWQIAAGGVTVTHASACPGAPPESYLVRAVGTLLPSGGVRQWWACPGCDRRADALYLPAGRDRLGCRRCCELTYRSQQTAKPVTARKERPGLWTERHYQRWESDPVTRQLVLVVNRHTRRRL